MRSLERDLLRWVLGALSLGTLVVVAVAYAVLLDEMNESFDADLKNVAEGVASYQRAASGWQVGARPQLPQRTDDAVDSEIVTLTWTRDGQRVYSSDPRVELPFAAVEGLSEARSRGEAWIVYTSVHAGGVAQAAQRRSARQQMAGESAAKIASPLVLLVLAVGGLLVYSLRRGLRPLDRAARDIAARSAASLEAIPLAEVPRELSPVVASTNELMERLSQAFTAQRRFLADAAHELRTPMTALRLQLQLLQRSDDPAARQAALAELQAGIERSQRLIEQLLQVARSERDGDDMRRERIDLGELVRSAVGSASARADARGLDLGASAASGLSIEGDAQQLRVLLDNLIENALRYTPGGGLIDVVAEAAPGAVLLRVVDSGPGIAPEERPRVFDRFYRGTAGAASDVSGSGLGLAIAKAIAERHGADLGLHTGPDGRGLEVRVLFRPPPAG